MNMLEVESLKKDCIIRHNDILTVDVTVVKINRNLREVTVKVEGNDDEFVIPFDEATDYDREEDVTMWQVDYHSNPVSCNV